MFRIKRKINYIIISFLLVFCYLINISYGLSANVILNESKEKIQEGEEVEVTINLQNAKTAAFTAYLYFDNSKLEYVSGPENTNVVENKIIYVWYDIDGGKSAKEGNLGTFKFKAKAEGTAKLSIQGDFYGDDGKIIKTEFKEAELQIGNQSVEEIANGIEERQKKTDEANINEMNTDKEKSNEANTNLEILAIENELLYPPFEAEVTHYTVDVSKDTNKLNIFAVPEEENAKVEIIGNEELKEGDNEILVKVTATNTTDRKEYEINVHKRNQEEENAYLEEKEKNKEQLEKLYEAEKTGNTKEEQNNKNTPFLIWGFVIIAIAIAIGIGIWRYKIKNK